MEARLEGWQEQKTSRTWLQHWMRDLRENPRDEVTQGKIPLIMSHSTSKEEQDMEKKTWRKAVQTELSVPRNRRKELRSNGTVGRSLAGPWESSLECRLHFPHASVRSVPRDAGADVSVADSFRHCRRCHLGPPHFVASLSLTHQLTAADAWVSPSTRERGPHAAGVPDAVLVSERFVFHSSVDNIIARRKFLPKLPLGTRMTCQKECHI